MLDYDGCKAEEVVADVTRLRDKHPELGIFLVEPSDGGWHVEFPKSELEWNKVLVIAEESNCDKKWLAYSRKYGCFAVNTQISKSLQPKAEVVNPPVESVESPVSLIVTPIDSFNLRCCVRLCGSIKDDEWVWREYTPLWDMKTRVKVGCRDESQAIRRLKWLSERIKAKFEISY